MQSKLSPRLQQELCNRCQSLIEEITRVRLSYFKPWIHCNRHIKWFQFWTWLPQRKHLQATYLRNLFNTRKQATTLVKKLINNNQNIYDLPKTLLKPFQGMTKTTSYKRYQKKRVKLWSCPLWQHKFRSSSSKAHRLIAPSISLSFHRTLILETLFKIKLGQSNNNKIIQGK